MLPTIHFSEQHSRLIPRPLESVYKTFKTVKFTDSWLIRWLMRIRGISSEEAFRSLMTKLVEDPPNQLIWCIVGRPWTLKGGIIPISADDFQSFNQKGYAKIIFGFTFSSTAAGTLVTTETEIYCTDEASRKKFALYWFFIRPFSGLVRKEMLRLIAYS